MPRRRSRAPATVAERGNTGSPRTSGPSDPRPATVATERPVAPGAPTLSEADWEDIEDALEGRDEPDSLDEATPAARESLRILLKAVASAQRRGALYQWATDEDLARRSAVTPEPIEESSVRSRLSRFAPMCVTRDTLASTVTAVCEGAEPEVRSIPAGSHSVFLFLASQDLAHVIPGAARARVIRYFSLLVVGASGVVVGPPTAFPRTYADLPKEWRLVPPPEESETANTPLAQSDLAFAAAVARVRLSLRRGRPAAVEQACAEEREHRFSWTTLLQAALEVHAYERGRWKRRARTVGAVLLIAAICYWRRHDLLNAGRLVADALRWLAVRVHILPGATSLRIDERQLPPRRLGQEEPLTLPAFGMTGRLLRWIPNDREATYAFDIDRHALAPEVSVAWHWTFYDGATLLGTRVTDTPQVHFRSAAPFQTISVRLEATLASRGEGELLRVEGDGLHRLDPPSGGALPAVGADASIAGMDPLTLKTFVTGQGTGATVHLLHTLELADVGFDGTVRFPNRQHERSTINGVFFGLDLDATRRFARAYVVVTPGAANLSTAFYARFDATRGTAPFPSAWDALSQLGGVGVTNVTKGVREGAEVYAVEKRLDAPLRDATVLLVCATPGTDGGVIVGGFFVPVIAPAGTAPNAPSAAPSEMTSRPAP